MRQLIDDMFGDHVCGAGHRPGRDRSGRAQARAGHRREPRAGLCAACIREPEIIGATAKVEAEGGCLSVPGIYDTIATRSGAGSGSGRWTATASCSKLEADGLLAICIQHEMDHLEGKLFRRLPVRPEAHAHPQEAREGAPRQDHAGRPARAPAGARWPGAAAGLTTRPDPTVPIRIVFAGTPAFFRCRRSTRSSQRVIRSRPSTANRTGWPVGVATVEHGPVKRRALELGLPVEQPSTLRDPASVARLAPARPVVVVAYGLILPQAVLDVPRLGCLNIHASLLPRWRGAASAGLLAGDTRTGVVIMKMDAGLDTGPMLLVRETAIAADETGGDP